MVNGLTSLVSTDPTEILEPIDSADFSRLMVQLAERELTERETIFIMAVDPPSHGGLGTSTAPVDLTGVLD